MSAILRNLNYYSWNSLRRFSTIPSGNTRLRRVLFNVPGSDERKIQKATQLNLDCVVLDLEDGVAINQKEAARTLVKQSLQKHNFGRAELLIRMNSIGSGLENADLTQCIKEVALTANLHAIVIPKVEDPSHIMRVAQFLDTQCGDNGKKVRLLAAIESAKGLINLKEICSQSSKLDALIFASEDLCANMGMTRTSEAKELLFARSLVVTHAVAFDLQAIDMVCLDFKNNEVLTKETTEGRQMGFTGKQAIHPNQIEPIYAAFRPSEKEIDLAKKIIEGNEKNQAEGKGAFSIDGKMIDMPMVKWALKIIQTSLL